MNSIIESSPAMPLVLPSTPMPEHDTEPALPISPVATLGLDFFILASQGGEPLRVYSLATAPVKIFNAWVEAIIAVEEITDPLCCFIIKKHSQSWDDLARLWLVIDLQVRGIDLAKYAYVSREEAELAREA